MLNYIKEKGLIMNKFAVLDVGCNISKWVFNSYEEAYLFCVKMNSCFVPKKHKSGFVPCNSWYAPNKPLHSDRFIVVNEE